MNAVLLLVVGAFSSTEFGIGFLHNRYLFYVVPLWLVATAVWAERRVPVGPPGSWPGRSSSWRRSRRSRPTSSTGTGDAGSTRSPRGFRGGCGA